MNRFKYRVKALRIDDSMAWGWTKGHAEEGDQACWACGKVFHEGEEEYFHPTGSTCCMECAARDEFEAESGEFDRLVELVSLANKGLGLATEGRRDQDALEKYEDAVSDIMHLEVVLLDTEDNVFYTEDFQSLPYLGNKSAHLAQIWDIKA